MRKLGSKRNLQGREIEGKKYRKVIRVLQNRNF